MGQSSAVKAMTINVLYLQFSVGDCRFVIDV